MVADYMGKPTWYKQWRIDEWWESDGNGRPKKIGDNRHVSTHNKRSDLYNGIPAINSSANHKPPSSHEFMQGLSQHGASIHHCHATPCCWDDTLIATPAPDFPQGLASEERVRRRIHRVRTSAPPSTRHWSVSQRDLESVSVRGPSPRKWSYKLGPQR